MKMHFLSGGRLAMRRGVYFPGAAREEMLELPVSCTLIKHEQGNVLFDTGCSPDVTTDVEARWGGLGRVMKPIFTPDEAVTGQLGLAGLSADDIDLVVCSHFHSDHCGCNEHFRNASIVCHADELAAAQAEGGVAQGYLPVDWEHAQKGFDTFTSQRDVFGDGRLVLVPVPGHTPGMTAALVNLDQDGAFILASDAVAVEANYTQEYAPKNSWDLDKATNAITEIKRMAATNAAQVIFGHDEAQWLSLRKGAEFYQ